jgi:hypothetical protein
LALVLGGLAGLRTDHLLLSDEDVTARRLAEYEWFTGNVGSTVSAEYLPPTARPRPFSSEWLNSGQRDQAQAVAGRLNHGRLLARQTTRQVWELVAGSEGATVLLPTLYWPGWEATAGGRPLSLRPQATSGLITFDLPPGAHTVTVQLGRTPLRLAAEWLSLCTLLLLLLLWATGRVSAGRKRIVPAHLVLKGMWPPLRDWLILLLLLLILARLEPRPAYPAGNLTWDFAQMGYLHHDMAGVRFDDGTLLETYTYDAEEVTAGETWTIELEMVAGAGQEATVALGSPALAHPLPEGQAAPPVIAAQTRVLNSQSTSFHLAVPADAPSGLVVPRLTLAGAQPLLPSGQTRGDLFLRPLLIRAATTVARTTVATTIDANTQGENALDVSPTAMLLREDGTLEGHFAWWTARPLGGNYHFSWRLQDAKGQLLAQLDSQPGYGFQPSVGWPAGRPVYDWLALRLPHSFSAAPPYPLVMRLYDSVSDEELLVRRVGILEETAEGIAYRPVIPQFALPADYRPLSVTFLADDAPVIALRGYRLVQHNAPEATLSLTLYWEALAEGMADYVRFVHLLDPAGGVVAQQDGYPRANSYPTGQWTAGEIITDELTLEPGDLSSGSYQLGTGFYRRSAGLPRLPALRDGAFLPDSLVLLPKTIQWP